MQQPLQISFRDMEPSAAVEARIREKAEKLDRFYDRIVSCRVVVESPHRHHHKGNLYHVRIDLTIPEGELVANRQNGQNHAHEDVYVAIRDAFDAMRRQLEEYARRRRGAVKVHEGLSQGSISDLVQDEDYGTIATLDGREVYFHRNSVLDGDFETLQVGTPVRFLEAQDDPGPKASSVYVVGP